ETQKSKLVSGHFCLLPPVWQTRLTLRLLAPCGGGFGQPLPQGAPPPLLVDLPRAAEGEPVVGDVLGDDAAGRDIGAHADTTRRHQRKVRADAGSRADLRPMLGKAVIIAGDRAGADNGLRTDRGVADIGQVVDLRAGADLRLL